MTERLHKMVDGVRVEMAREEEALIRAEWAANEEVQKSTQYIELRKQAYPLVAEQLDMMYRDRVNGTNEWMNRIMAIKNKYPKPTGE